MNAEQPSSPAQVQRLVGRVLSRFYDVPCADSIHIVAEYEPIIPDGGSLMNKAHEAIGGPGLTIAAHGCQHPGEIWLDWSDVPTLIVVLQQALRDMPPNSVMSRSEQHEPSQKSPNDV